MRLNKRRLAALAMSAVMAASTMPFSAFAEEVTGDLQSVEAEAVKVEVATVEFNFEKNTVSYTLTDKTVVTDIPANAENIPATCTEPAYKKLSYKIPNFDLYSETKVVDGSVALGHEFPKKTEEIEVITKQTHTQKGLYREWYECTRPGCPGGVDKNGKEARWSKDVEVDPDEHVWDDEVIYTPGENMKLDDNGMPVLIDPTKPGQYTAVYHCVNYGKDGDVGEKSAVESVNGTVTVPAEAIKYAVITATTGIRNATDYVGRTFDEPTKELPLENDEIELTKCSEPGSYTVEFRDGNDQRVSEKTYTVTAHHMVTKPAVVFATASDMRSCDVTTKDGAIVVTNKSCYLPINYEVVYHCAARGCDEKTTCNNVNEVCPFEGVSLAGMKLLTNMTEKGLTADPAGTHSVVAGVKNEIDQLYANEEQRKPKYEDLVAIVEKEKYKGYVAISEDTSDCEKPGKVTVTFYCAKEPAKNETVAETKELTVYAKGHNYDVRPVAEVIKPATCTSTGLIETVYRCDNKINGVECGARLNEEDIIHIVPMLAHSNQTGRNPNGTGCEEFDDIYDELNAKKVDVRFRGSVVIGTGSLDIDSVPYKSIVAGGEYENTVGFCYLDENVGMVEAYAVSVCDNCDHEVELENLVNIKVLSVKNQDAAGHAGQITLQATYKNGEDGKNKFTKTETFPYFTSLLAYLGRVNDETVVKNGLSLDSDGVFRYYTDGSVDNTKTGLVDYCGGQFYVINGVLASEANGLVLVDDVWYFMANGQVQRQHTGIAMYDGETFYIENGKLASYVNGLVPYMGGTFLFAAGRLCSEVNGLWQDFDGSWYFLALGQVQTQHTGVAEYDGEFFYVRNGKLASDFNGTVDYDGAKFNVVAGQLYDQVA